MFEDIKPQSMKVSFKLLKDTALVITICHIIKTCPIASRVIKNNLSHSSINMSEAVDVLGSHTQSCWGG